MQRAIDLRGGVALNVITMIGIGPLVTIPLVLAALHGPLALAAWIAGAIVALCDGLVWAELASRLPGSGGTYVYLRTAFGEDGLGRAAAFLFNWQFLLYAPCLLATGYIGFANYAAYLWPAAATPWLHDAIAVSVGIVTIVMLYRRTVAVSAVGAGLAIAAMLTLLFVIAASFRHFDGAQAFRLDAPVGMNFGLLAGFSTALYVALYDYVGYAAVALLGDEVVLPVRTIPRAILISILIVAALYVLLQIGVLGSVPWRSLLDPHGAPTSAAQYVGSIVVEHAWGRFAAVVVTLLVLVTAFASLYGNLFGFSRIPFAAARDGAFLRSFARLHPDKQFPHVALLTVGALSLIASLFTLDQVIAFLTAGIVLVQGLAQVAALALLRRRGDAPFRMPLYPLPALVAAAGWTLAFIFTGWVAIALGVTWLLVGAFVFAGVARANRWWPFAAVLAAVLFAPATANAGTPSQWSSRHTAATIMQRGFPVFTVDAKPFFIYGASFFYERIPPKRWREALQRYARCGINTIDVYVIWNWHQPSAQQPPDFDGTTDPRRNLLQVLRLAHEMHLKVVLRPGPVIRNEWRNGGYPAWLLALPQYNMPLSDVLAGRYPATATLQNAQADAASEEWLENATHLQQSREWLQSVLRAVAPYADDVIAIALDDDQGAYLDNDTWPAPHWHRYVSWLASTVRAVAGPRVPLFINTFQMRVPAASPAWAWGDWYQSDAYVLGPHDLAQIDFSTGLLQTQPGLPVMYAEFQAGWLQAADEAAPRPSDPRNTALALHELLRDGVHGIVNFPLQDTIYPAGWEAPWANWSYAWDAAFTSDIKPAARYASVVAFGADVSRYGAQLAQTHPSSDVAIIWPPTLFSSSQLATSDYHAFADATIAMQRECDARGLTCALIDPAYATDAQLRRYRALILPIVLDARLRDALVRTVAARMHRMHMDRRLVPSLAMVTPSRGFNGAPGVTLLRADDDSYAFVVAVNAGDKSRPLGPFRIALARRTVTIARFELAARSARLVPVGLHQRPQLPSLSWTSGKSTPAYSAFATPPPFVDASATVLQNAAIRIAFAPDAGARISELRAVEGDNAATGIGLLRDAVDPEPPATPRDYIAAYTHPLPAGTFNRAYDCAPVKNRIIHGIPTQDIACTYDAPDLPAGGARFERTISVTSGSDDVVVSERFTPRDPNSSARLVSVSGFAFAAGDTLLHPSDATYLALMHAGRLTTLRWRAGDVAQVSLRATRQAEIVTLVFARRDPELRLSVREARNPAKAARLL